MQDSRPSATSEWSYQPALDGLRGFAVAMVLCFHGGFAWMTGGYVGVSVFFTLSGFLITSLLLVEQKKSGSISLSAFYGRRLKRLLPASLLCLATVAVMAAADLYPTANHVRREVVTGALQVANWNAITQHVSYADLVHGGAGPLDHFWSLSIEEQFYWLWPIAFLGIARLTVSSRTRLLVVGALTAAAIGVAPWIAHVWGPDVAYWATPARLAEILTGATLAVAFSHWSKRPDWLVALGWIGFVAIVAAAIWLPTDSGPAYRGWLGVASLASVALIAGLQPNGPLRSLFAMRPLVLVGRVSYGVYVFHWPVFVFLTATRTGIHGIALFAVRLGVTMVIAATSFVLLEQRVRRSRPRTRVFAPVAALATAAVVSLAIIAVPLAKTSYGAAADVKRQVAIAPSPEPLAALDITADSVPTRPLRIAILGDSTAEALSAGMVTWAAAHPAIVQVSVLATPGCGFVRSATLRDDGGVLQHRCDAVLDTDLPLLLQTSPPDVVVIMITLPDITDRGWTAAEGELNGLDPRYLERKRVDYATMIDQLQQAGVRHAVWLTSPLPNKAWLGYLNGPIDPRLWDSQRVAVSDLAVSYPGVVEVQPFDKWLEHEESAASAVWRSDGIHLDPDAAERVMGRYLASVLLQAVAAPNS